MSEKPILEPASLGRRFLALIIDWLLSVAVSPIFDHQALLSKTNQRSGITTLVPLVIFFIEVSLLTSLTQASAGQRFLGIKVVDDRDGSQVGLGRILLRTLLICLVIPPLLTFQGRGLHDRVTHTLAV